jgi:hypothetical protein
MPARALQLPSAPRAALAVALPLVALCTAVASPQA